MYGVFHVVMLCGQVLLAVASGGVLLSKLANKKVIAALIAVTAIVSFYYTWRDTIADLQTTYHAAVGYFSGTEELERTVSWPLTDLTVSLFLKAGKEITRPIPRAMRYGYLRGSVFGAMMLQKWKSIWAPPYWDAMDKDIAALGWPPEEAYTRDSFNKALVQLANQSQRNGEEFILTSLQDVVKREDVVVAFLKQRPSELTGREAVALYLGVWVALARQTLFEQAAGLQSGFEENRGKLPKAFDSISRYLGLLGYPELEKELKSVKTDVLESRTTSDYLSVTRRFDEWFDHLLEVAE